MLCSHCLGHSLFNVFFFSYNQAIQKKNINRLNTLFLSKYDLNFLKCARIMKEARYLQFKISFLIDSMTEVYIAESKTCTMLTSFELTCWWNSVFIKKKIKRMQKLYYENEARFCSLFFGTAIYGDMKKEGKKQNFVFAQIEQFCTNAKSNFLLSFIYSKTHGVNSVWMFFFRSILWCKEYFFSMGKSNTTQPNP